MDPLLTGPRWWRICIHAAFASATLTIGLGALVFGGGINLLDAEATDSGRDRILYLSMMCALGLLSLRLSYIFGRDAVAFWTERRDRPVTPAVRMTPSFASSCLYAMIVSLIFVSSAKNVPLWCALLILVLPLLLLFTVRLPKMRKARHDRLAARTAAQAAHRPVARTRHQRVVSRKSREQRRKQERPSAQ